jgi:hypothetical protein
MSSTFSVDVRCADSQEFVYGHHSRASLHSCQRVFSLRFYLVVPRNNGAVVKRLNAPQLLDLAFSPPSTCIGWLTSISVEEQQLRPISRLLRATEQAPARSRFLYRALLLQFFYVDNGMTPPYNTVHRGMRSTRHPEDAHEMEGGVRGRLHVRRDHAKRCNDHKDCVPLFKKIVKVVILTATHR